MFGLMSNFLLSHGAWAQSITVPFGRAAQFGLLSGGNITTDTTAVAAWGKAGATGSISPLLTATDSVLTKNAGTVSGALADLQTAITYCQSLTAQAVTQASIAKPTPAGVYQFSSSITLDSASQLHLLGTASTWHIFRINGNLTVTSGGGVTIDQSVRPDHIIWQVTGTVTQEPMASLPGIVLAGGNATITDVQFGAQALLTLGNIYFADQEPTLGRAAYMSPSLLARPSAARPSCGRTGGCDPVLGRNELGNASAENHVDSLRNHISNMPLDNSDADCWSAAIGGLLMSPDYFHTGSPSNLQDVNIPNNLFGTQAPHSPDGKAYMGFYAAARRDLILDTLLETHYLHDYIRQSFGDVSRFEAGKWYYGEFYVSRGDNSLLEIPQTEPLPLQMLGMYLSEELPQPRWFANPGTAPNFVPNPVGCMHLVPPGGSYATSPLVTPQVQWADTSLMDTKGWVRVAGCFRATGRERCAVIGSFRNWDDPFGYQQDAAYYYLDDLSISAFPKASVDRTLVRCDEEVSFSITDCLLPLSSGAEYRWTSDAGFDSGYLPTPDLTYGPKQPATYSLTVRVPVPGQPGVFQEGAAGQVFVDVQTPVCQLDCQGRPVVPLGQLIPDFKISGNYTFPQYGVFYVEQDLLLTNAFVVVPEGTMLLFNAGTKILLDHSTLVVNGATLTAACAERGLWSGIQALDAVSGVQTGLGETNRIPELSGMADGIVLSATTPTPYTGWFELDQTRFSNNLRSLTSELPVAATAPAGTISSCWFDADSALLDGQYPLWHVRLGGNRLNTLVRANTFDHAWFGLYAPAKLRIGSTPLYPFTSNTFRNQYLAGIYEGDADLSSNNALQLSYNKFEFSTASDVPTGSNRMAALSLVHPAHQSRFVSATGSVTTYGVFTERVALSMLNNTFTQPRTYADYDYIGARNRQVGAHVQFAPTATIETNDFINLHEGLAGLSAPNSLIRNNLFDDCKIGAHVLAVSNGVPSSKLCLDCNSFMREFGLSPTSLLGVSYGVLIDAGAQVTLERFNASGTASNRVLGNFFNHFSRIVYQNDSINTPVGRPNFTGFDNAIVNNSSQSLEYLTYDDDEPDYNPATYNMDLKHAPAAVLKHWWGSINYYGSTNVVVTTPNSPGPQQQTPFRVDITNDCASRGLGFTRGLLERSVSISSIFVDFYKRQGAVTLLSCFPNPAEDHTTVNYALPPNSKSARLIMRDLMGRVVFTHSLDLQTKEGQTQISLTTTPSGILICQLVVDGTIRASQRLAHEATTSR